jgi:hypothetical protein
MKYYKIDNANEPDITGPSYPQIVRYQNWCHDNYEYLISELGPHGLPERQFIMDYLELDSKSLVTDFLSAYNPLWGFIVSEKAKNILAGFSLPAHKFIKAIIKKGTAVWDTYYWLYMVSQNVNHINFEKSVFDITKGALPAVIETRTFSSAQEIVKFKSENPRMKVRMRKINIDIAEIDTDIFQIGIINFDWIISEKMKLELEENSITGYTLKQIDWIECVSS